MCGRKLTNLTRISSCRGRCVLLVRRTKFIGCPVRVLTSRELVGGFPWVLRRGRILVIVRRMCGRGMGIVVGIGVLVIRLSCVVVLLGRMVRTFFLAERMMLAILFMSWVLVWPRSLSSVSLRL